MTDEIDSPGPRRYTLFDFGVFGAAAVVLLICLFGAIQKARETARNSASRMNLKLLGQALQNYHDNYKTLPPGGIFDPSGKPFHSWTSLIAPYQSSSRWYSQVDFRKPWNDPGQLPLMRRQIEPGWNNPRVSWPPRLDQLPVPAYSANAWLMHRNSKLSLTTLKERSSILLLGEVGGNDLPLGCPGNWQEVGTGINSTPTSFGCLKGEITLILMADGSVKSILPKISPKLWNSYSGPENLRPEPELLKRPLYPDKASLP